MQLYIANNFPKHLSVTYFSNERISLRFPNFRVKCNQIIAAEKRFELRFHSCRSLYSLSLFYSKRKNKNRESGLYFSKKQTAHCTTLAIAFVSSFSSIFFDIQLTCNWSRDHVIVPVQSLCCILILWIESLIFNWVNYDFKANLLPRRSS